MESILLYGAESWTFTKKMEKRLDGNYTRLLRLTQNISWKEHKTNKYVYGELDQISNVVRKRRLRFIGHCWRGEQQTLQQLLLWEPTHGNRGRGRPCKTYLDQLYNDTNMEREELATAMQDRVKWRKIVNGVRARSIW